ncbi:MAG: family 1 glycosylhydrolase [Firmicutes bacterium]|nr:family 1 glycosylhydrolase [Alicyclobacillaceae bacterium]MCL6498081.1 family 1 glycosylhydrolase [Bacillota bacterium]
MSAWPRSLPPFLWGVATSSHQVEGQTHNDWTRWEAAGRVREGQRSGRGCDHWSRYQEDYQRFAALGINAYRFSVEWSRIEPEPGQWDREALATYRRMVQAMRSHGWVPCLTLHHFTLPLWLADRGGLFAPDAVERFTRYAATVVEHLGDLVDLYVTINEPMVWAVMGYAHGSWPPGRRSVWLAWRAANRLGHLHRHLYRTIKAARPTALVGWAHHYAVFFPYRETSWADRRDAAAVDWLFNRRFVAQIAPDFDFIGVNYYFRQWMHWRQGFRPITAKPGALTTDMGWEIYPAGLRHALRVLGRWQKPLVVKENGIAARDDRLRQRFLVDHLRELAAAQAEGLEVRGYFYWSALDNFEWAEGFHPRFGLFAVDYATQARTPRPSARLYRWLIEQNRDRFPIAVPDHVPDAEELPPLKAAVSPTNHPA